MPKSSSNSIPVQHIAKLSNIPITSDEEEALTHAFVDTLKVVEELKSVDVSKVQPTFQVTGLENVWREDMIDEKKMFTQAEALFNAKQSYDGYFVVPQVIDQD